MDKQMQRAARLFAALADATRLRILALLAGGEVCVCDIHESLGISQPKASRHLGLLRRAGLVETRREGLWVHYRLLRSSDPMPTAVVQAVIGTLPSIDTIRRDARKLQKATGCRPAPMAKRTRIA
jgi:ArsR family transcriptional regulator, arsenate/arsenite/antimonite-responsive transcriptional repressor